MTAFSQVLERVPARVIELTPDMFADEWPDKPAESLKAGLRLLSESDIHTARAQAADRAVQAHDDEAGRVDSYNDTLMAWAVASALCAPDDTRVSYLDSPFENVFLAFTSEGIRRIWEELEVTHILRSPMMPELDDEAIVSMIADLPDKLAALGPGEGRVRRLLAYVRHELHR